MPEFNLFRYQETSLQEVTMHQLEAEMRRHSINDLLILVDGDTGEVESEEFLPPEPDPLKRAQFTCYRVSDHRGYLNLLRCTLWPSPALNYSLMKVLASHRLHMYIRCELSGSKGMHVQEYRKEKEGTMMVMHDN
jgi:hypothetical protein